LLEILDNGVIHSNELENLPDHSPYRLRFSVWRGAERIFNLPQLVLEIEAYDFLKKLRSGNKDQKMVAEIAQGAACWKWHPGQSNCVGWFRVHIDDERKLCFIDEIQSDTIEEVASYLKENKDVLSDQAAACFTEYLRTVKHWHVHGFSCLYQWVADIDYNLGIHSRESAAAAKQGMTPSDRKWNTCYGALIKRYSLTLETIEGYPAPIWVTAKAPNVNTYANVS